MELYDIWDIIRLIGLPLPTGGRSSYYVQCPCCDDSPQKRHLNINLKKGVFRCPKCDVHGGILDLYSLFTGVPRNQVLNDIASKKATPPIYKPKKPVIKDCAELPISEISIRDNTYKALLSKLTLSPDHQDNLLKRGLDYNDIQRLGYKTMPVAGMSAIAAQLRSEGIELEGVPGFYQNDSGEWTFTGGKRGILIPVLDQYKRIQGLQLRLDNVNRRKYRWVSSSNFNNGCRSEGWTHISGEIKSTMIITEGPMKADIINALKGLTVLAVPGVNSLKTLEKVLNTCREHGLIRIMTAFDMDFLVNHHVQNGYNNLLRLIDSMGLSYGIYVWDSRFKGLDDYIWHCCKNEQELIL